MLEKPPKTLPWWVEPVIIALFYVVAVVDYLRGELFWAGFFAVMAVLFTIAAMVYRPDKK